MTNGAVPKSAPKLAAVPTQSSQPPQSIIPGASSPPRIAVLDPRFFSPDFDVIAELSASKSDYIGDEAATIYGVPAVISLNIDRIRSRVARVSEGGKPGGNPTIACCLAYGVSILGSNQHVKSLSKYRDLLNMVDSNTSDMIAQEIEELSGYFSSFIASTVDFSGTGKKRLNVMLPAPTKQAIGALSSDLGTSFTAIATLCLMITLAEQSSTISYHQTQLADAIARFYRRAEIRAEIAKMLLDRLDGLGAGKGE